MDCPQTDTEDDHTIIHKEVEAAVQSLEKRESARVDNIPAELVQAGEEDVMRVACKLVSIMASHTTLTA